MTAPTTTRPDGTQIWEGNTERLERRVAELEQHIVMLHEAVKVSADAILRLDARLERIEGDES